MVNLAEQIDRKDRGTGYLRKINSFDLVDALIGNLTPGFCTESAGTPTWLLSS
jgi:hypothetical protein